MKVSVVRTAVYVPSHEKRDISVLTDDVVKSIRSSINDWAAVINVKTSITKEELLKELGCKLLLGHPPYTDCIALPEEWFMVMARCGGKLVLECDNGSVTVTY